MDQYMEYIHTSRYARFVDGEGRREMWPETIRRYVMFMKEQAKKLGYEMSFDELKDMGTAIERMDVMPSMRAMMTAGPALERENVAGYNCSYLPVDHPRAFDEALYILMNGTGVGFSVEREFVDKLPDVPENITNGATFHVQDSKKGWADALKALIDNLYKGIELDFDTSNVRPSGARLKTFGGRASGPIPLLNLRQFVVGIFRNAVGRKLTDIECHDIMCKIGEIVVVGGVRRSAMISLSNMSSNRMRDAKSGEWWTNAPHRALANNSWVNTVSKPDVNTFTEEWLSLMKSGSGERGIFNRVASQKQAAKHGGRDPNHKFGTNPCSEIILRPYQFCNLSEVVARKEDTIETLEEKVRIATIIGTLQSTLTDFKHLRKVWSDNTKEERLLGVSITGIFDCPLLNGTDDNLADTLDHLRKVARETNEHYAKLLGIEPSKAITCVKPSGTVSQLVDAASGIHTRHSPYYIRTVRGDNKDPLTQFMIDKGVPYEACAYQPDNVTVFSFPIKAPEGALCREDITAIEHLEMWKVYQEHWCEHKPSITVSVKPDEWLDVGSWVYRNFDIVSGISFLPYSEHTYAQAPYQECDKERYEEVAAQMPVIDWQELSEYEHGVDHTKSSQTLACSAEGCEAVDI